MWKTQRKSAEEALGDFLQRVGKDKINEFKAAYVAGAAFSNVKVEPRPAPMLMGSLGLNTASSKSRKSTGPRTQQVLRLVSSCVCVCEYECPFSACILSVYTDLLSLARWLPPPERRVPLSPPHSATQSTLI